MDSATNKDKGQEKKYEIFVNGVKHTVLDKKVSYEQVVQIAFPVPPSPDSRFTVAFRKAHKPKEGTLKPGNSVEVKKEGAIFNVKATGKS